MFVTVIFSVLPLPTVTFPKSMLGGSSEIWADPLVLTLVLTLPPQAERKHARATQTTSRAGREKKLPILFEKVYSPF